MMRLARCACEDYRTASLIATPAPYALLGGDCVVLTLYRCDDCGRVTGRPDSYLTLALERGTLDTLQRLCNLSQLH